MGLQITVMGGFMPPHGTPKTSERGGRAAWGRSARGCAYKRRAVKPAQRFGLRAQCRALGLGGLLRKTPRGERAGGCLFCYCLPYRAHGNHYNGCAKNAQAACQAFSPKMRPSAGGNFKTPPLVRSIRKRLPVFPASCPMFVVQFLQYVRHV
jgi:hypothetical protein